MCANCFKSNFTLYESRPDRDDFVIINWDNIQSNYHSQVRIAFVYKWQPIRKINYSSITWCQAMSGMILTMILISGPSWCILGMAF